MSKSRKGPLPLLLNSAQRIVNSTGSIFHQLGSISRREAFALFWFALYPFFIFFDGDIIECIGLYPSMAWDTALKYYYLGLSSVEAVIILLYGIVFTSEKKESLHESRKAQTSKQHRKIVIHSSE